MLRYMLMINAFEMLNVICRHHEVEKCLSLNPTKCVMLISVYTKNKMEEILKMFQSIIYISHLLSSQGNFIDTGYAIKDYKVTKVTK